MAGSKTATPRLRTEPEIKQALQRAAERDHCAIADMAEAPVGGHGKVPGSDDAS